MKQNLHKGLPEVLVEHSVDYLKREFGDIMGILGFVLNPMHHIFYQYLTFWEKIIELQITHLVEETTTKIVRMKSNPSQEESFLQQVYKI